MAGPPAPNDDPAASAAGAGTAAEVEAGFRRGEPGSVRTVRERIRRIIAFRGYGIPAEDRKDLEQEVMAQLWRRVGESGAAPPTGIWGLAEVVTARRCIDWLRTRKREVPLELDPIDLLQDPHAAVEKEDRRRRALTALERLPIGCRRLIYLHAGREMTYREIAALLGKSEGALRVQMHRCVERARQTLAELGGSRPR